MVEQGEKLTEIITALNAREQQILREYAFSEGAHWAAPVSANLGITDNHARVLLNRVKRRLAKLLEGEGAPRLEKDDFKEAFSDLDRTKDLGRTMEFQYDVFLSHSAKDKAVVRDVAERLRKDGVKVWFDEWVLKPGDSIPNKIEEGLERSRVLVLCMSANGLGSDWPQLESQTYRFRDPLNKERHFIPLRLDDAPIKGSLAQFLYIDWLPARRDQEYTKFLELCQNPEIGGQLVPAKSNQVARTLPPVHGIVQYTNAKVLIVGDTHSGKTGLAQRLATAEWRPSAESTVGAWSTQWQIKEVHLESAVTREILLWDFGGQADQRLIHELYMDRAALILLVFDADQEDVLPGLRDWLTALRRSVGDTVPVFLVAGRIDTGFKSSRGKLQAFAKEQGLAYHETSAKTGDGCDELRAAIINSIAWERMVMHTSPRIFKLIKDEILKLRGEGQVLHTFKELRELLRRRLPDEPRFTDDTLQTVIRLLDGPGVVKELDYGTYILLAPEWINAYAQAVIRTLRSAENDLGVLPLSSIAEGKLIYQSIKRDGVPVEMKRLPPAEERVVLGEMERQLEQRGLCLRQGDKLVFPSHCGRDRDVVKEHPSVFVSYAVKGFLDDIYATLVVKLADSESFQLKELWRDAADFVTLAGDHHMGLKLTRASGSDGEISVYFSKGVTEQEQVIFANYIHAHLQTYGEQAQRLRHYVCPKCHAPKGNPEVLMKKLLREKQNADTECDDCGERFPLWDALEKRFASKAVRAQVDQLQADDLARRESRRRGKLLALEVGARITSADQKCFEIPATEDEGLDMELEFTNDDGEDTGRRLCLQLKSGNSHLTKRKTDGAEIFTIKKQRWVEYWLQQPHPVMLVIGTFSEDDERAIGKDKLEFAEVRWMEITSVLKRESANGTKPVKQIEFKG
ncbi:MAG TPA: TIR domain-containing protein, partial [Chthoniobacterales bacterium]|nr:TIR domain-containing protein [Chthoniobacterales bacterium]